MFFVVSVHCVGEQKLNIGLGLVNGRGVYVTLTLVLDVALYSFLYLHNDFAWQVGQQINRFLLPSDAGVSLKEMRDIVVNRLRNRTLKDLAALSSHEVGVILGDVNLVQTGASNDSRLCPLLLGEQMAFDGVPELVGQAPD